MALNGNNYLPKSTWIDDDDDVDDEMFLRNSRKANVSGEVLPGLVANFSFSDATN